MIPEWPKDVQSHFADKRSDNQHDTVLASDVARGCNNLEHKLNIQLQASSISLLAELLTLNPEILNPKAASSHT